MRKFIVILGLLFSVFAVAEEYNEQGKPIGSFELIEAIRVGDLEQVKHLIKKYDLNVNFEFNDSDDETPQTERWLDRALATAVSNNHLDIVQYLIEEENADIELLDGHTYFTPLGLSFSLNHLEIAQYLLDQGANPAKDIGNKHRSLWIYLDTDEEKKFLKEFCQKYPEYMDNSASNAINTTALMGFIARNLPEQAQILIECGADTTIRDIYGNNALDKALLRIIDNKKLRDQENKND